MKTTNYLAFSAIVAAANLVGCATPKAGDSARTEANGSRLWAQNCTRCHNSRSPSELSPAQWDVVMLHMRVRAGLTAREHQAIREFLQTSN